MTVTSMIFLFCFLPVSLLVYYIAGDRAKEYILLIVSLLFYAFGCLDYMVIFVIEIALTVTIGRIIAKQSKYNLRKVLLILGIAVNSGALIYHKYCNFIIDNINSAAGTHIERMNVFLPLGISFFTFKAISYLADIYMGRAELKNNPVHDALYLSFFGQIQAGPLSRYSGFSLKNKGERLDSFLRGVYRFASGFCKKILIADVLFNVTNEIFAAPAEAFSMAYAWLGAVTFSLQLFFDFSGYSDMAIGITQMFGYDCMENFNYPYMTESISGFWRRWHISLSEWFRDYIYIPLGGSRNKNPHRVYLNLLAVWFLTGLWHGANWNFIAWGLGYFVAISFEKITNLPGRLNSRVSKLIYRIFAVVFVIIEWVMFNSVSLLEGVRYIGRMFSPVANGLANARTLFLIRDYGLFYAVALILCFPVIPALEKLSEKKRGLSICYGVVAAAVIIGSFIWAVSFVVSGSNNPFAYANF